MGNGAIDNRSIPATVPGLSGVTRIAAFGLNSLALKQDGTVWAWGKYFSTSVNTPGAYSVPVQVPGLANATGIASGSSGGLAIQDGAVWAWGGNAYGERGDGMATDRATPGRVTGPASVTAVSGGVNFALALASDGSVWGWGKNEYGETGPTSQQTCSNLLDSDIPCNPLPARIPNLSDVIAISAAGDYQGVALKRDGTGWIWGNWSSCDQGTQSGSGVPTQVQGLSDVVAFASSQSELLVIKADRTVWRLGSCSNAPSQVPDLSSVSAVSARDNTVFAVRTDGTVWSWGENRYGNLGDGTYSNRSSPVLVANETADGPLDLVPEESNNILSGKLPSFYIAATKSGGLSATTLYVDLKGGTARATFASSGRFAATYNVYVAAYVPALVASGTPWLLLDSSRNWGLLTSPMAEFMRGVALDSQTTRVRAEIFQNMNLIQLPGTAIYEGYGTDADEMLSNGRYRDVFTVPSE